MGNPNDVWKSVIAISKEIDDLTKRIRKEIGKEDYPKADAMFETSAEVLLGLKKAYDDFLKHEERAWRG
ncbi:MAG TPA: hypothetical protein VLM37_04070 [Fibrobacteraceae bacterium]|nr:hypothetical protein [Fibrobacteraceae bacterium]